MKHFQEGLILRRKCLAYSLEFKASKGVQQLVNIKRELSGLTEDTGDKSWRDAWKARISLLRSMKAEDI